MEVFTTYFSPLGTILLTATDAGLTGLWLDTQQPPRISRTRQDDNPAFGPVKAWLDAYFRSEQPNPRILPLDPPVTAFQKAVWAELLAIPYGESQTYGDIAKSVGSPRGAQAVGQAVGRNPIGIIIPCHRILGAGGQLTGFAWGLDKKKWLLRHEGVDYIDHP